MFFMIAIVLTVDDCPVVTVPPEVSTIEADLTYLAPDVSTLVDVPSTMLPDDTTPNNIITTTITTPDATPVDLFEIKSKCI